VVEGGAEINESESDQLMEANVCSRPGRPYGDHKTPGWMGSEGQGHSL